MATPRAPEHVGRFRWSRKIGSIAGIPIRVHLTLVLLLAWIALSYSFSGVGPRATVAGIVLVGLVFVIIAVHELGHALVARRFGVRTREILLLPIGGIATLERFPERPVQELAVALVGPAINLAIAAALYAICAAGGLAVDPRLATGWIELVLSQLIWINVALALFNLIPAFPMDGGRALRALLAIKLPRARATDIAAALGKLFAIAIGVFGLLYNPWLAVIAVVIWFGASQEAEMVHLRAALTDIPVAAAMNRSFEPIAPDQRLADAARTLVTTGQREVPIVDHGSPLGVLTHTDIATAIAEVGPDATVGAVPHHDALAVAPEDRLDDVLDRLVRTPNAIAVVVDHGETVGMLTPEQLSTFVALHVPPAGGVNRV